MGTRHVLGSDRVHNVFDNSLQPVLTIDAGDIVTFDCPGQPLPRHASVDDLSSLDSERPHTVVGPVALRGASPGDTLVVEIVDVVLLSDHGHCFYLSGGGLLGADFAEPYIHNFELSNEAYTELRPGIRIPLRPFCGIMGVAPAEPGIHSTVPPRSVGGNLDIRHLTVGSTLFLPVCVDGALFSCGDGHAAQGDGEVCETALETAVRATLRFSLRKAQSIPEPRFLTPAPLERHGDRAGYFVTCACGNDLYECSQRAVRYMLDYLVEEFGLSREEAYVLCSLTVDLKISEIVDEPNWIVSAYLPLGIFA